MSDRIGEMTRFLAGETTAVYREQVPMARYTTLRLGGPAELLVEPDSPETLKQVIRKAREIIQRHFSEPGLTVSGIAEEVGMSDSRLSVAFKQVYQETPMECITFSRMHRAQRLLRDTEMPVKDIATECGYYDISAFNRRFKSYTGQTPQQFRQQ